MSARPVPALAAFLIAVLTACVSPPPSATTPAAPYDIPYLLAPGDRLEVTVHTAPELSQELVVAPDGLVSMPLAGPVMAMGRTPDELAAALRDALASELIDPDLDVVTTGFAAPKLFIGGEVRTPGVFDLPAGLDSNGALAMAGGLTPGARLADALLIRRLPGGAVESLRIGQTNAGAAMRRFDVLYVPANPVAAPESFARDYIREALPRPFQLFFDVTD
jgi:protein involved in polysaccharide export with SLBB domain